MDKDLSRGAKQEGKKWNEEHTAYMCTDGIDVQVPKRVVRQERSDSDDPDDQIVCANGVEYNADIRKKRIRLLVSGTEFNRDVSQVVQGAKDIKTVTFPGTVRKASGWSFS